MRLTEYKIRIDGDVMAYKSRFTAYGLAAFEAFGKLGLDYPSEIEIWAPQLLEAGYGPYHYRFDYFVDIRGNQYGCPAVLNVHRSDAGRRALQDGGKADG